MIYLVNILTILTAIIYVLLIANEQKAILTSLLAIIVGISMHAIEMVLNIKAGTCVLMQNINLLENLDNCIDYESGNMIFAQALILAGVIVILIQLNFYKK